MADRYFVGADGVTWGLAITTGWSATSGGAPGASSPTSVDDAHFDNHSGSPVIGGSAVNCRNLIVTSGFTGTFTGSSIINVYGNVTLGVNMADITARIQLHGTCAFTSSGVKFIGTSRIEVHDAATVTLQDDMDIGDATGSGGAGQLMLSDSATFDANNKNIRAKAFYFDNGTTVTILMGSGTWEAVGVANDDGDGGSVSSNVAFRFSTSKTGSVINLTPGTATMKLTGSAILQSVILKSSLTYGKIWMPGTGGARLNVSGSSTIGEMKVEAGVTALKMSGTFTIGTWNVNGSQAVPLALSSTSSGTQWTFTKASGTVSSDWLTLKDSVASGGATFNATHSTDLGNNSGWNITAPGGGGGMFMIFSMLPASLIAASLIASLLGNGPVAFARRRLPLRPTPSVARNTRTRLRRAA